MRTQPLVLLLSAWFAAASLKAADPILTERLERPDGSTVVGRVSGDRDSGFRFVPLDGSDSFDLGRSEPAPISVRFERTGPEIATALPPFHVAIGRDQRISGRLRAIDPTTIRLDDGPGGTPVVILRVGASAIVQRAGEAQVLQEGFESLDAGRWSSVGSPSVSDAKKLVGDRALRLPAGGSALTCRLATPVGRGRVEIAFFDDGRVVPHEQAFVDLLFRGDQGPETVRALIGWQEESLAVESPGGPALAVQRLARRPGWRRLGVRFGPDRTEVSVDGDELAHGKGPGGPLIEIRLAAHTLNNNPGPVPADLFALFDDLRVVRFAEPTGEMEADPSQDEVRLVGGDQIFGAVNKGDGDKVDLTIEGRTLAYPWGDVSGVYLRREAKPSRPITGLLVRLEWRAGPGNDPRDLDAAEGMLSASTDAALALETPYAGTITIPRDRLRRLRVLGKATRIVIDPFAHHLGDNVSTPPELLDPPQFEGGVLERAFDLAQAPEGAAHLVIDAVQVVGEAPGLRFSERVRDGELVTNILVNGKRIDTLNRHIMTSNEVPETVRVAVPKGLLKAGKNLVRFEQVGLKSDPNYLDDLGILGVAIDLDTASTAVKP